MILTQSLVGGITVSVSLEMGAILTVWVHEMDVKHLERWTTSGDGKKICGWGAPARCLRTYVGINMEF
jgi:hypothetical protein